MPSKAAAAAAQAAARGTARTTLGQKKSCDLCVSRKRRCDGAIPTCGFCQMRGTECHYSLRRPNRPRGYAKRLDGGEDQASVKLEGKLAFGNGYGEMQHGQLNPPPIGWKRIHFSASAATGLVGTKENAFLGHFFSCLGFLPLTHERLIRGTMMEILLRSPPGSGIVDEASTDGQAAVKVERPIRASGQDEEQDVGDPASACALWCTIAMGALVHGQPPETAAPYMHLAWTSLSQCFDTVTVESGRAFLMMAYLYNFMRDDNNFCKYLHLARKVINRLPDNTVQKQEIDELVMMGEDTRIFHTAALEPTELDDYCEDESPALQVPDVVHKSDLCRLLLQADRQMMKAFLRDHRAQTAVPPEEDEGYSCHSERTDRNNIEHGSGHVQEGQRRDKIPREVLYAHGGDAGYLSGMSINMDCFSIDSTKIDKETSPSRPGDETWKYTEEVRKIFARLGDAADAPEIRGGVGSLLYNSILGYLDMVTGSAELEAGFDKVKHCAGIISRYPGLCRFSTWRHLSHCLLSFLAKLGDMELFEELRQAYNSVCAEDAPKVPPHEEWTMVGFCDHIFCRSMDHLDKTWGGLNGARQLTTGYSKEQRWQSEQPYDAAENNIHWTSHAPESHPAFVISRQNFPPHERTSAMLPPLVDPTSVLAQQFQYMAPAQRFPSVGTHSTAAVNPVWSTAGHPPVMPPSDRAYDGASAYVGAHADSHTHNVWQSPAPPGATNASFEYRDAGDMWPYYSSIATASAAQATSPTAAASFREKNVDNMAVRSEEDFCGTSGRSTSEGGYSEARPSADGHHWWVDGGPSSYPGEKPNG